MAYPRLQKGDVIRVNVRTSSGWKGRGVVVHGGEKPGDLVEYSREDGEGGWLDQCFALRCEVSKLRDQTWHGPALPDEDTP